MLVCIGTLLAWHDQCFPQEVDITMLSPLGVSGHELTVGEAYFIVSYVDSAGFPR